MITRGPAAIGRWLERNMHRLDGPSQLLGDEPGSLLSEYGGDRAALWSGRSAVRWLLAAAWSYEQAAGNMAIPVVYRGIIDAAPGNLADRWYLPATPRDLNLLEKGGIPAFGIETRHALGDFDVVATSISYTVLFMNFCAYLRMSGMPLRRADREDRPGDYPMVMAGGQAYCAPEFMSAVFDCVWLGEIEDEEGASGGIGEVCEVIAGFKADGSWRRDRLGCYELLARRFNHLYFPRFTSFAYAYADRGLPELTKMVSGFGPALDGMAFPHRARKVADLDRTRPLTQAPLQYVDPGMGAGDTEIEKGCPDWCVFCRLSWVTKPARQHSIGYIVDAARAWRLNMGSVDISLVAPDPPMYTQRKALVAALLEQVTDEVDTASMRIDDYLADPDFSLLLSLAGMDSITFGLEGNSQRMRDLAGKGLTDDAVAEAVTRAIRAGVKKIKLYLISNWPGEDTADVMRVVELGRRLADIRDSFGEPARGVRIQFSWTPLLLEAQTPLQWFEVTAPDYTLQRALDMLRDVRVGVKIGTKANPAKLAFFQACQRSCRAAGEAITDVIEAIGTASWGGFPKDMRERLDAALIARGFRNGLADLFGERFEHDLLGWEHIDTGVAKSLMWRTYRDMVEFLEGTDAGTYDEECGGAARGNEWVAPCTQTCQGRACGACTHEDLRIRTAMIRAGTRERDLAADPVVPVDHTTVAARLRLRVYRPEQYRWVSAEFSRYLMRRAAFRATEATGFPDIAKRTPAFASDSLAYRDRSCGVDYADVGVTRPVPPGKALEAFLAVLGEELSPWMALDSAQVLPAAARLPSRPASLWELETALSEEELAAALRRWDEPGQRLVLIKSDSFYAGSQAQHEDARSHVDDFWAARDGHRVVVRMVLTGRLGPYQAVQALLGKASWLDLAVHPAVRLGFFVPGAPVGRAACAGCGGVIPEGLLGEIEDADFCPRCRDEDKGTIIAGLLRSGVLKGAAPDGHVSRPRARGPGHQGPRYSPLRRNLWTHRASPPRHTAMAPRFPRRRLPFRRPTTARTGPGGGSRSGTASRPREPPAGRGDQALPLQQAGRALSRPPGARAGRPPDLLGLHGRGLRRRGLRPGPGTGPGLVPAGRLAGGPAGRLGAHLHRNHRQETAMSMSEGHVLARAQIAKHGRDRYPTVPAQYAKLLDEMGELAEVLMLWAHSPGPAVAQRVREEYADVGLALHELGNKLDVDLVEAMHELVAADRRSFA